MIQIWFVKIVVVMGVILGACSYLIYVERKLSAYMQDRMGPNRVGPFGPAAAACRRTEVHPQGRRHSALRRSVPVRAGAVHRDLDDDAGVFRRAVWAHVDRTRTDWQFVIAPGVDIGIVFILAVGSLAVYSIILGGWASNNKYSLLGRCGPAPR